ncbi:RING-type E3 ubiquitin transferase [Sarracenia purpurea var. burkii]
MQGQRSAIGSLPGALGFDDRSTSSDASIDQQNFWNNMQNSAHDILPDYITSPGELTGAYLNSLSEGQNLSGWNAGEPSSSGTENRVSQNEQKAEYEERQYEPDNNVILLSDSIVNHSSNQILNVPFLVQNSRSSVFQDLNMTAGSVGNGSDCHIMECDNAYKSDGSENLRVPSARFNSDPFGVPSGSGGYLVEENDGRPGCSSDSRRLSCKRKVLEGNTGQSSISGSSNCFQQAESSVWHAVSGRYNAGSSLIISSPPSENILSVSNTEQVNASFGLDAGGVASENPLALNVVRNVESSLRNYRARINPSHHQDSVPLNVTSTGNMVGHSNVSSLQQSSRLITLNNSMHMRSPSAVDNASNQRQPIVVRVPPLQPTSHASRWSGVFSPRLGNSSSSGERHDDLLHGESNSIGAPRNISEHPMLIPENEMRNSAQNLTNWSLAGGNTNDAVNVDSTSRTGSSSRVHQLSGPNRVSHHNPSLYPRRLSELVRRSLLSSSGSESGGHGSSNSSVRSVPSSQEMEFLSGAGHRGHHLSQSRSAMLLERQLNGALGIPHSLRALAAASEGRSRLVSEIRGVLDLMRRGEGLQLEDVMIPDQSFFFGMADIHDRHRDMRLDVDNMSYEELLALEERIGNVNTGLSEETILNRLKQRKYFSITMVAQLEVEPCCVCQEEYNDGEDVGRLECGHEFHSACIKQWLMHKNLCPICKTTALSK